MAKINILFCSNSIYNIIHYRSTLLDYLIEEEMFCHALIFGTPSSPTNHKNQDPRLQTVTYLDLQPSQPFYSKRQIASIKKSIQVLNPKLCLIFTLKANILFPLVIPNHIPKYCHITGIGSILMKNSIQSLIFFKILKENFKNAEKVIFHNEDDQNLFLEKKIITLHKTKVILGSGVDTKAFYHSPIPSKDVFRVLFIGRLIRDKGLIELLEVAKSLILTLSDIRFDIVGDYYPNNPSSISPKNIEKYKNFPQISFHGRVKDVRPFIHQSHLLVLPSYREGLSKTLIEAMSMARPILTTDTPGCRHCVSNPPNGILVPIKDRMSLQKGITKMYYFSLNKLTEMGFRGRSLVIEKFSNQVVIRQYSQLFTKLNYAPKHFNSFQKYWKYF